MLFAIAMSQALHDVGFDPARRGSEETSTAFKCDIECEWPFDRRS